MVEGSNCRAVFHAMSEEDVRRIMQHPVTMTASDGGIEAPTERKPHPRYYGAFARVLVKLNELPNEDGGVWD